MRREYDVMIDEISQPQPMDTEKNQCSWCGEEEELITFGELCDGCYASRGKAEKKESATMPSCEICGGATFLYFRIGSENKTLCHKCFSSDMRYCASCGSDNVYKYSEGEGEWFCGGCWWTAEAL